MKRANTILLVLLLSCIMAPETRSQQPFSSDRNSLGISITQLAFVDFRVAYERKITPSHGIIVQFAYKPAFTVFTDATNPNFGEDATAWCYRNTASWLFGSVGYRYYLFPEKGIYLSPEFFYKKMFTDNMIYSYGKGGTTNTYEVRSMDTDMIGMNLLIGKKFKLIYRGDFHMGLDIFTGATVRFKDIFTTIYGSVTSNHYHDEAPTPGPIPMTDTPAQVNQSLSQIFLQFGIILYTAWK
jgi:hypothetical protein